MTLTSQKPFFLLSLSVLIISLGGCVKLLPDQGPRPQQIFLDPDVIVSPHRALGHHSLAVAKPTAESMNESNRLVIHYDKNQLTVVDHIADVIYQDNLPEMVQRHLVKTLSAAQIFKAVGFATDTFQKHYILESDIEHFAIHVHHKTLFAHVMISAKLLDSKTRQTIWQKTFSEKTPINHHKLNDFVRGLKRSYQSVLSQIIQEVDRPQ